MSTNTKNTKRRLVTFLIVFLLVAGILALIFMYFISDLFDPDYQERFRVWVEGLGFRGVLVLFGIQVLQIVIAPIPGGPVQIVAGAAFGTWWGLIIMIAGCIAATVLIFFMIRRFGIPLIKSFFGEDAVSTWGFLSSNRKAALVIFIFFLIPGTPKDFFVYLGPLTKLSLFQFTAISIFARTPAILSSTIMGDAAMRGNWLIFISVFAVTAITGILGIRHRKRISQRFSREQPDKKEQSETKEQPQLTKRSL